MSKVEYAVKGLAGSQSLREHAGLDLLLKTFDITMHTKYLHAIVTCQNIWYKNDNFFCVFCNIKIQDIKAHTEQIVN